MRAFRWQAAGMGRPNQLNRSLRRVLVGLILVAVAAGCASRTASTAGTTSTIRTATTGTSSRGDGTSTTGNVGGVPRPAHVVVVIEENHSESDIIGNPDAPYLNSLAAGGALFTQSYGIGHPSQPNYLAVFSGSTQGVSDDTCPPPGAPFRAPNLSTALRTVGASFATYSEGLPSAGSTACSSGAYARKHNPAIDFADVAPAENRPFTAFPTDLASLPTVSFVIPNLDHDMHDGTIGQADTWLRTHMDSYVKWAAAHDSLLVVTWDEDDYSAANRIPTLFFGPMVRPGRYPEHIDHYTVLGTITAMYDAAAPGTASKATPVTDVWTTP